MNQTGRILILISILGYVFPSLGAFELGLSDDTIKKVVIDAGHGGKDPGNLGTGRYKSKEKNIALEVALLVGDYIEKNVPGVDVVYTRQKDHFVELHERTVIANNADADLFISIHCDAFTSSSAYGSASIVQGKNHNDENMRVAQQENSVILLEDNYEERYEGFDPSDPTTYIMLTMQQNAFFEQSISLAQKVQSQFKNRVHRKDRGVKQQPLYVTSRTSMPAILIELGFLTNKGEEDFLNSAQGKELMASAIYRAFKEYKKERENIALINKMPPKESEIVKYLEENPPADNSTSIEAETPIAIPTEKIVEENPIYKVQIATSGTNLKLTPQNFKGLTGVEKTEEYKLYKYYWGGDEDLEVVRKNLSQAKKAGFSDAFLVAFYNGNKISIKEAQKINP
jgi:N-acetylmuramoyl-L-alanine amidase